MSLLGTPVYANPDTAIWLAANGGGANIHLITGDLEITGDLKVDGKADVVGDVTTLGGSFQVEDALGVPKMFMGSLASQSFIESDDVLYFTRIGSAAAATSMVFQTAPALDEFSTGLVKASALNLADGSTSPQAPVVGRATLTAGTALVNTFACDVTSYILLTHTNLNASTAVGTLRVSNKGANDFTVVSVNAAGVQEAGDDSDFDWLIVNPV